MNFTQVADRFAVAPQLRPEELQAVADAGFDTIICNRPDAEEPGQPPAGTMREAAQAAGLCFHHIPVSGGEFPPSAVAAFAEACEQAEGRVLAYGRTGTRSITLHALANTEELSADERIGRAQRAGYDLSSMRGRLGE